MHEITFTADDLHNLYWIVKRSQEDSNRKAERLIARGSGNGATTSAIEHHLDDANIKASLVYRIAAMIENNTTETPCPTR